MRIFLCKQNLNHVTFWNQFILNSSMSLNTNPGVDCGNHNLRLAEILVKYMSFQTLNRISCVKRLVGSVNCTLDINTWILDKYLQEDL